MPTQLGSVIRGKNDEVCASLSMWVIICEEGEKKDQD